MKRDYLDQYVERPKDLTDGWHIAYIGSYINLPNFKSKLTDNRIKAQIWIPSYSTKKLKFRNVLNVFKPAFPGYVFLNFKDLESKQMAYGEFVGEKSYKLLGAPTTIKEEEVLGLESMVADMTKTKPFQSLEKGDLVRIISGPMKDFMGIILTIKKDAVVFDANIGVKQISIEVDFENVERIA